MARALNKFLAGDFAALSLIDPNSKIRGIELDSMIFDDVLNEQTPNETRQVKLKRLLAEFRAWVKEGDLASFMVIGPMNLTAKLLNGSYRSLAFIGGEGFMPADLKVGAKGQFIMVFRPTEASDFSVVEIPCDKLSEVFGEEVSQGLGMLQLPTGTLADQIAYVDTTTFRDEDKLKEKAKPKYENFGDWS